MAILSKQNRHPMRLRGVALKNLMQGVWERDKGRCVLCGRYVAEGAKAHHEPPKSKGGQDVAENLVTLCTECHHERHFGANPREVKSKVIEYLENLKNEI